MQAEEAARQHQQLEFDPLLNEDDTIEDWSEVLLSGSYVISRLFFCFYFHFHFCIIYFRLIVVLCC